MGLICSKGKKRDETTIQNQIKLAVQEDENIRMIDNIKQSGSEQADQYEEQLQQPQLQHQGSSKKGQESRSDVEEGEKSKKKSVKKKTTSRRDDNYLKIIEYSDLRIQSYTLVAKQDDQTNQYQLTINFQYQDYSYSINFKAILQCEPNKPFYLTPMTFQEAHSNSNYQPFFIQDTYFNIDLQLNSNLQSFNQLLEVKRNTKLEKQEEDSALLQTRKYSKIFGASTPTPKIKKKKKKRDSLEMMELIHIFDLECSPRFNQLLVSLTIQNYCNEASKHLIAINDVYFLFNEKPSLDKQEVHRALVFYEHFDFSLQELSEHLLKNKITLSNSTHLQLSINLLKILYECYNQYLYRLNFTLNTVFWVSRVKKFKLQTFCRIQSLLVFDGKDNTQKFKNVSESKAKMFQRDFDRDFGAVLDIILYFKLLAKDLPSIKKLRRKRKNLPDGDTFYDKYLALYDETFYQSHDVVLQGIARLKFYDQHSFEQVLEEIKQSIQTLKEQLKKLTQKQAEDLDEDKQAIEQIQFQSQVNSDSECAIQLTSFNVPIDKGKKEKLTEENQLYYQMLYSSLFYSQNFNIVCDQYLEVSKNQFQIAYAQIHYSVWKKLTSQIKEVFCVEQQATLNSISKKLNKQQFTQDSFNYYLLLELVTKMKEKPINIISSLKQLIWEQNTRRRKQAKPRLSSNQRYNGIIEMRKAIIIDIFFIDYFVSTHSYNKALQLMQQSIQSQLKFNLKNYLLYSQSLFINGLLNEKTLQTVSAMLNLEIAKIRYDEYFPNQKILYIEDETQKIVTQEQQEGDKTYTLKTIYFDNLACENMNVLEFHLGKVYFNLHDKENALKCLRRVKITRQKKFDMLSDEVIEVVVEILKILVEQEDSGAASELCYEYKQKFRESSKKNFYFKSRYVARLQLIMAAIFECNGTTISALRYYQKANRTFNQSKTNSYILQIHIRNKIFKQISDIKAKALQTNLLGKGQVYNLDSQFSYRVGYLSERVKPYFNNQFLRKSTEEKVPFNNPVVIGCLISIYSMYRHQENDLIQKKIEKLSTALKKKKVDEFYGFTLEKQGILCIMQCKYTDAIKFFQLTMEIHERFLVFPLKEKHTLDCLISMLCSYCQLGKIKEFQDHLNTVDEFIAQFYETIKWNNIPTQPKSNKFLTFANRLGRSFIYQISELDKQIEKFQKVRYKLIQNFSNLEKLKSISDKYLQLIIKGAAKQSIKKLGIDQKRYSCLFGLLSQQKVIKNKQISVLRQQQDLQQIKSLTEFETLETQNSRSTQPNLLHHYRISKDREINLIVTSERKESQLLSHNEITAIQKTSASQDNLETTRQVVETQKLSHLSKEKSKCSTGMPSQVLKTMSQIGEICSQSSKNNKQEKKVQPNKIDPFQKTRKK